MAITQFKYFQKNKTKQTLDLAQKALKLLSSADLLPKGRALTAHQSRRLALIAARLLVAAASGFPELLPTLAEMGFSIYPCPTAVLTVIW